MNTSASKEVILCNENYRAGGWTRQRLRELSAGNPGQGLRSRERLIGARWDSAGASALRQGVGEGWWRVQQWPAPGVTSSLSLPGLLDLVKAHPIRLLLYDDGLSEEETPWWTVITLLLAHPLHVQGLKTTPWQNFTCIY